MKQDQYQERQKQNKILKVDRLESETVNAIQVRDTNDKLVWLPKSKISIKKNLRYIEIELPKWLADKNPDLEVEDVN